MAERYTRTLVETTEAMLLISQAVGVLANHRVFTLNGAVRPQNPHRSRRAPILEDGEHRSGSLCRSQIGGQQLEIVALDGMPLSYHKRNRNKYKVDHILVPPAGRVEAIVTGALPLPSAEP